MPLEGKNRVRLKGSIYLAVLFGLIFVSVRYYTAKLESDIKAAFEPFAQEGTLQYDSLDISVVKQAFILRNVSFIRGDERYTAKQLILQELDREAMSQAGDKPKQLLGSLQAQDVNFTGPETSLHVEELSARDIHATRALLEAMHTAHSPLLQKAALLDIGSLKFKKLLVSLPIEQEWHIDEASIKTLRDNAVASLDLEGVRWLAKDRNARTECGRVQSKTLDLSAFQSLAALPEKLFGQVDPHQQTNLYEALEGLQRIEKLRLTDIQSFLPEPSRTKELRLDTQGGENAHIEIDIEHQTLSSASLYVSLYEETKPELSNVLTKPLDFSGSFKLRLSKDEPRLHLDQLNLQEASLFAFTSSATLGARLPNEQSATPLYLYGASSSLQDTGLLHYLAEIIATVENTDAKTLLSLFAHRLRKTTRHVGEHLQPFAENMAQLVEQGGTVHLTITPEKPVPLDWSIIQSPQQGFSSSRTPAKP